MASTPRATTPAEDPDSRAASSSAPARSLSPMVTRSTPVFAARSSTVFEPMSPAPPMTRIFIATTPSSSSRLTILLNIIVKTQRNLMSIRM
jgi:hypothetical protein